MPENKQAKEKRERYELLAQIANSNGFRVSKEDLPKIGHHLKELERKGFVLFVPGVGWVDSTPAIRRYKQAEAKLVFDKLSRETADKKPTASEIVGTI